jgi:hypothetical protein
MAGQTKSFFKEELGTRVSNAAFSDDQIELAFSVHFTWGYPDYVRQAFNLVLETNEKWQSFTLESKLNWQQLRRLLEDADSERIRYIVAGNPNTPQNVLDFLARGRNHRVAMRVAEHPRTHSATLCRLAKHEHHQVRMAVAEHPAIAPETLEELASDEHADVRYVIAESFATAEAILEKLSHDENPYVSARASKTLAGMRQVAVAVITADFSSMARRRRSQAF